MSKLLGPAGAVLSIVSMFLPKKDSPELVYMKGAFTKVFFQLDNIERGVNELKDITKWESQRATFSKDINNINLANDKMKELVRKLQGVIISIESVDWLL